MVVVSLLVNKLDKCPLHVVRRCLLAGLLSTYSYIHSQLPFTSGGRLFHPWRTMLLWRGAHVTRWNTFAASQNLRYFYYCKRGVTHYLWIRLYWYAELSIANSKHTSAITGSVEYSMNSRPLSVSLLSRLVCVRFVLSVCLEGWVNFCTTSDRYCSTNNCLYCNRFFIYCLCRYANCVKGVFCGSACLHNSLFCWHTAAYLFRWFQIPHFLIYA